MNSTFFQNNRKNLLAQLKPDSFLVLTANGLMQGAADQPAKFEQEANFWYLTGIDVADWQMIVDIDSGEEWLIEPKLLWFQDDFHGSLTPDNARHTSGIKNISDKKTGLELIRKLIKNKKRVYTLKPHPRRWYAMYSNRAQYDLAKKLKGIDIEDVGLTMAKLRAIKQPAEIEAIQKAVDVTVDSMKNLFSSLKGMNFEYEAEALLNYQIRKSGLTNAYDPMVASGKNACVLHYDKSKDKFIKDSWLLVDAGAKYKGYPADITRTIPLGKPTRRQIDIYEATLRVHDKIIELCKPGQDTKKYIESFQKIMKTELVNLGLLKSDSKPKEVYKWMPHAVSHGLGIDVHDSLGKPDVFAENMILTVEPGIYIKDESFGVRIEDDILITENGPKILSGDLPTDLDKLRGLVGGSS